jgi:hypothetical protein
MHTSFWPNLLIVKPDSSAQAEPAVARRSASPLDLYRAHFRRAGVLSMGSAHLLP